MVGFDCEWINRIKKKQKQQFILKDEEKTIKLDKQGCAACWLCNETWSNQVISLFLFFSKT